jgi:CRISPR-associated endoribonuclease Cas6
MKRIIVKLYSISKNDDIFLSYGDMLSNLNGFIQHIYDKHTDIKNYSISNIIGGNIIDNKIDYNSGGFFVFSTDSDDILEKLISKLLSLKNENKFVIDLSTNSEKNRGLYYNYYVEVDKPNFKNNYTDFSTLTYMVLLNKDYNNKTVEFSEKTNKKYIQLYTLDKETKTRKFNKNFATLLENQLKQKISKIYKINIDDIKLSIEISDDVKYKKQNRSSQIFVKKTIPILVNSFTFRAYCNSTIAKYIYDIGVGSNTSYSFGMVFKSINYDYYNQLKNDYK